MDNLDETLSIGEHIFPGNVNTGQNIDEDVPNIIKIIGVGGAGGNAVCNMKSRGIQGVDYVICNTDRQALLASPIENRIQLGKVLTHGLGAGNDPQVGRESAIEAEEEINAVLENNTRMVIITAGMGGGTGTGAAPVIAELARKKNILTIGIVTIPYRYEGKRVVAALRGVEELSKNVDSLLVINSDKLLTMYGDLDVDESLLKADEVLALAAKGLAEIISKHMSINVDFADVRNAMCDSGAAVIGLAEEAGEDRAQRAVKAAITSPLLNNQNIYGAQNVVVNVVDNVNSKLKTSEQQYILDFLNEAAGGDANKNSTTIWGYGHDDSVPEGSVRITVIATGFNRDPFSTEQGGPKKVKIDIEGRRSTSDDGERSQVVDFENEDDRRIAGIRDKIYNSGASPVVNTIEDDRFSLSKLGPATAVPLSQLDDATLRKIEEEPAYVRFGPKIF